MSEDGWIKVTDSLPDLSEAIGSRYIIYAPTFGSVGEAMFVGGYGFVQGGTPLEDKVTHWCLLPEPPKETP